MIRHRPTMVVMIVIPLYVGAVFAIEFLAPLLRPHAAVVASPPSVRLAFVGDLMFDRYIREKADASSYDAIMHNALPALSGSEYAFGNLEGPITTSAPVSDYNDQSPSHYTFTFATSVAPALYRAGFRAVSLGNNHSLDFGMDGVAQTKEWLTKAGIGVVGVPGDPYVPWRTATSGVEVAVYAYDNWIAKDLTTLTEKIRAEATSTFVVVLAHWGDEYDRDPVVQQVSAAHTLVDAGADLIVGSHPHVIQSKELYKGVWIYYSLGNFVFDQYFSEQVRCGAVLSVKLERGAPATTTESFVELQPDGTTATSSCAHAVPSLW